MELIEKYKQALEASTNQGHWMHNGNEFVAVNARNVGIGGFLKDEDNHLIVLSFHLNRTLIELVEQQQSKNERLQTNLDHACGLSIENIRIANELQAQISEKESLIESLEQKYIDATSDLMDQKNEIIESQKEEIEKLRKAFEHANKAIHAQHCTMNHMENTEHEKGQISGLIQASNIIDKAFSQLQEGEKP